MPRPDRFPPRRARRRFLACLAAALLSFAGCSSGSPSSPLPPATTNPPAPGITAVGDPATNPSAPGTTPADAPTAPSGDQGLGLGTTIAQLPAGDAHPLDGLTPAELAVIRDTLSAAGFVTPTTRYPYVGLHPPDKAQVAAWRPGSAFGRAADVVLLDLATDAVTEVVVDVVAGTVVSSAPAPDFLPAYVLDEFTTAIASAKNDLRVVRALDARGIQPNGAMCFPFSPGAARTPEELGRRLLRVSCFAEEGAGPTFWSRPIEGLVATVDVDSGEVLSVSDSPGGLPGVGAPAAPPRPALAPIEIAAPQGPNVVVAGSSARWAGWQFRWRFDRRVGLIVADVSIDVGTGRVPVLYEASLSDLYVPYQNPDPAWSWRTFLDAGEFGMGSTIAELQPATDCPATAIFAPGAVVNDAGDAQTVARAICLFERPTGTPSWRHAGADLGVSTSGGPGVELVARAVSTVGNYDYLVDVVFGLDGSIRFDVAAAGVVLQKAVDAVDEAAFEASADHDHGVLVAPGLVGVNHDHFLDFRLDLDVGGPDNRFVQRRLVADPVAGDPGRTGIWRTDDVVAPVETAVAAPAVPGSEIWRFESSAPNALGQRPAYVLDPLGSMVTPLVAADDPGLARAPWALSPLWVTAYDPSQQHAGGRSLPDGGAAEDGLAVWAAAARPIADRDLVAWFTIGFHHIVRSEDLPTMPVHRATFELRPENVFPANPLPGLGA